MKILILILSVLLQSALSLSQTAPPKIYNTFEEYFVDHIKVLSRPVVVFHYSNREYMGFKSGVGADAKDPQRQENMKDRMVRFWDLGVTSMGMAGNGLYAALDPVSTRSYGGATERFGLYFITLKQGAKFLETREPNSFPPPVIADLTKQGCINNYSFAAVLTSDIRVREGLLSCRDIVRRLFNKYGVSFLAYGYNSMPISFCNTTDRRRDTAFVIVEPESIDFDQSFILVRELPANDNVREARIIVKKYFNLQRPYSVINWDDSNPSGQNSAGDNVPQDFKDWVLEHGFGCDKRFAEDAPGIQK